MLTHMYVQVSAPVSCAQANLIDTISVLGMLQHYSLKYQTDKKTSANPLITIVLQATKHLTWVLKLATVGPASPALTH